MGGPPWERDANDCLPSRSGTFVNDRPRHAKPVTQVAEASRIDRLRHRQINLPALSKKLVDPLRNSRRSSVAYKASSLPRLVLWFA